MPINLKNWACGECGRVYNPWLGDRFWRDVDVDGEERELICDECRSDLDPSHVADATAPA